VARLTLTRKEQYRLAILVLQAVEPLATGVERAGEVLADGSARETLASLIRVTNAF